MQINCCATPNPNPLKLRGLLAPYFLASPLLMSPGMTRRHPAPTRLSKKIVMTLGDLIAAAYEVSEGLGRQRAERAAMLLAGSSLSRRCSRQLRFVR
jgi:hypothetical protein